MSDYSCYFTIDNTQNKFPLNLVSSMENLGYWDPSPPQVVEAGQCIYFRAHDASGPNGSIGGCAYTTNNGVDPEITIGMSAIDPYSSGQPNTVYVNVTGNNVPQFGVVWKGLTGNNVTGNDPVDWENAYTGYIPQQGHPVSILVTITNL